MKIALLENTTPPTAAFATPALADFTQVTNAGTYTTGGTTLGTWANMCTEAAGTVTFNTGEVDATWAAHASNTTTAYWGLCYNSTFAGDQALFYVELGGPVNMVTGALTVAWNASGMATLI